MSQKDCLKYEEKSVKKAMIDINGKHLEGLNKEFDCTAELTQNGITTLEGLHLDNKAPDGGWGWVVVFGSFMISLICDGFSYTTGIFYEHFLQRYKETEAVTSIFDSIMTGMIFAAGPFASGLSVAFGCRRVAIFGSILAVVGMLASVALDSIYGHMLALGLVTGTGLGLLYLPQVIIVTYWFDKRLSLATGIAFCGSGIGIAIFAVMTENMIHSNGWKGTMLVLSAVMFTCIFFSALFRSVPHIQTKSCKTRALKSAFEETFNFRILKEILFLYFAFATLLNGTVYYVPVIFIKDHVKKTGIGDDRDAMQLMVVFGLADAVGRAVFGYIADNKSLNRLILYAVSVISNGAAIGLIAAFGHNYTLLTIGFMIFGATEGAFVCSCSLVMVDLFGVQKVSNAFGINNLIIGIASFIGPPIIGQTVDDRYGYRTGFWISSILTIISGVLLLFLPIIRKKFKPKE